jgi:hypothetical protein
MLVILDGDNQIEIIFYDYNFIIIMIIIMVIVTADTHLH